jgi:hypothetical protein
LLSHFDILQHPQILAATEPKATHHRIFTSVSVHVRLSVAHIASGLLIEDLTVELTAALDVNSSEVPLAGLSPVRIPDHSQVKAYEGTASVALQRSVAIQKVLLAK